MKKDIDYTSGPGPTLEKKIFLVFFIACAWYLRSYGGFDSCATGGDEFYITHHAMTLKSFLLQGRFAMFTQSLLDFFTRPGGHVLNLFAAVPFDIPGMYFAYCVYGVVSLFFVYFLASWAFGKEVALGVVALGALSTVHINYSMRVRCIIPCFMMTAASVFFFFKSHYGENKARDKGISGILLGTAFTIHTSCGIIPFLYVFTEFYVFITDRESRNGAIKRFVILLISMASPIIFWESISYTTIHFGTIESPYFRHYLKRLSHHENFNIARPPYFHYIKFFFKLESIPFLIAVTSGIVYIFKTKQHLKKEQKTFVFMTICLAALYGLFPYISCMPRLTLNIYIFLLPIGGLGLKLIFAALGQSSKVLAYSVLAVMFLIAFMSAFTAVKTIKRQQRMPYDTFRFLKEKGITKLVVGKAALHALPYLKVSQPFPPRGIDKIEISDKTGYVVKIYFPTRGHDVIRVAKANKVRYLLASYFDYNLLSEDNIRHFMFHIHKLGVGRPYKSWGDIEEFPMNFYDEEPYKTDRYNKLYGQRKLPFSAEKLVWHTMLYDLSKILRTVNE